MPGRRPSHAANRWWNWCAGYDASPHERGHAFPLEGRFALADQNETRLPTAQARLKKMDGGGRVEGAIATGMWLLSPPWKGEDDKPRRCRHATCQLNRR
jgi:hypothetical protein